MREARHIPAPDGSLEMTSETEAHIIDQHFTGVEAGGRFSCTWPELVEIIGEHAPGAVEYGENGQMTLEIDAGRIVGRTGVEVISQLAERGLLSDQGLRALEAASTEIYTRNFLDDSNQKRTYVESFNGRQADETFKLIVRSDSICALIKAELVPTSEIVVKVNREESDDLVANEIKTIFTGPDMGPLPADQRLFGNNKELWARAFRGETLTEDEQRLLDWQLETDAEWNRAAFLDPAG